MRIEPTEATLGAEVSDVRLASLGAADWSAIEAAFHAHAVLIFRGQHLSEAEQVAFGRRFGELSIETLLLSNVGADGSPIAETDPLSDLLRGNEGWHTDSSFKRLSAKASILSAHEVPASGGETEWADMRAAYDALGDDLRARIDGLCAFHSLQYSQSRVGATATATASALSALAFRSNGTPKARPTDPGESPSAGAATRSDPLRPLVKVHPVTGRPALFVGRHAYGIPGLDPAESEQLLDHLVEEACQPPRLLTHRWEPGDFVIWDNRCTLHRARPYDRRERRVMVHTRVNGDPATELALGELTAR